MARIPAPRPQTARLSLLNSAPVENEDQGEDQRWETGFEFAPEACSDAHIEDPCDTEPRVVPPRPSRVTGEAFTLWSGDKCSTMGSEAETFDERAGRARRLLERCQSKQIARELWEGTQAQASMWPNQFLAQSSADVVTTGPSGLVDTLGCLEQALADCGCGERGMIHATRQVVTHWAALGNSVLRREGGVLLTVHDTIVVSDAGYTGTGPEGQAAAASVWAYATGLVSIRLAPVYITPSSLADATDRAINDAEVFANREASYSWDGCCHFAAEVDLEACAVGGLS